MISECMAYSKDTREMVLKYLSKGHFYEETHKELGVSVSSLDLLQNQSCVRFPIYEKQNCQAFKNQNFENNCTKMLNFKDLLALKID